MVVIDDTSLSWPEFVEILSPKQAVHSLDAPLYEIATAHWRQLGDE
jgi:hypothetical protein